jgi:hypothetical protein
MKIMVKHDNAGVHEETPHAINYNLSDALKRRAQSVINNRSIDADTRAVIRYGLEINDPWLGDLMRRVDAGETIVDNLGRLQVDSSEDKIEALAGLICRAGNEPAAALLVLMATLENATHPKALANSAKHFAFTRCGELNLNGMVDAQIAVFESELLDANTLVS